MKIRKFLLACFVASATLFATCEADDALSLDKSSSENTRLLKNLNSTSKNDDEDDSNTKLQNLSPFEPEDLENIEEQSKPASKDIQDPNDIRPIKKHITKRCICPIITRTLISPFLKRKFLFKRKPVFKPYVKKPSLNDLKITLQKFFKAKYPRDTDYYKQETDEENIGEHRKPGGTEDEVNVAVGRNIDKGRRKKKFICRCYQDNCRGKHCEPSRPYVPSRLGFIGPDILNFDRTNKNDNIYQVGPIYNPVYYTQNIKRQKGFSPNSPAHFPQNPLTQYPNTGQPFYYYNTPYNEKPVFKEHPYDIVGSAKNRKDNKFSIHDCMRLYDRDFCINLASTQRDYELDYEPVEEDDYTVEDYDGLTEPSWDETFEPLEPDGDSLGTLYEDYNEEYYPLKSKYHDYDEAVQYRPKESTGKAMGVSGNSKHYTKIGYAWVKEEQPDQTLGSVNVGQQFLPDINIELKEKTIKPSKEIVSGIPVLGKVCAIETTHSLEMTKDKACLTENKQYTFSSEEKSLAEDLIVGPKHREVDTSSEEREIEVEDQTVFAPIAEIMHENLPSMSVTETVFEELEEESNSRFLGNVMTENSEEEIVATEFPAETIIREIESVSEALPAIRNYEIGAAKTVTTASRRRPVIATSPVESSLEADNQRIISFESDEHKVDAYSKEIFEQTPIKYYSPQDRLLEYKKSHQNEYYSSVEQSEHTASYDSIKGETVEDEILVGMTEGSGMLGEKIIKDRNFDNVRYFEDYESSGDDIEYEIKNGEKIYVSGTTVAEIENIDDQYTGADFTEDSGISREVYNDKDEIIDLEVGVSEDSLVGSPRNLYSVTDIMPEVGTLDPNNNDNIQLVGSSRNDKSAFVSPEIYYIPQSSELEDTDTYLGKLSPHRNKPTDSEDSDLSYIGDGVRLPLKIIKLNDGSYSLALSDRGICDYFLKTQCPCYIRRNQRGVKMSSNDKEGSMKDDDDEERNFKDYFLKVFSKKAGGSKAKASVDDSGIKFPKVPSKQSMGDRADEKREEEQYENYMQTLLDVNDIPIKDRVGFVINSLDKVANDEDILSRKEKFGDKKDRITQIDSTVEHVQSEKNTKNLENREYIGYDTSRRVEVLKAILSWVKDLVLAVVKKKS